MPVVEVTPQSFHLDLMNQTFRRDNVTKTGTLGTIGLFADTSNDFSVAAAKDAGEADPQFTDKYFFYFQFVPSFDLRATYDMTVNVSFQKGDERSMWDTVFYSYYDDSTTAPQFWAGPTADLSSKVRTNSQFHGVDSTADSAETSAFKGVVNYDPYYIQVWREILPADTQDADGNEIIDGSVFRYQPDQVIAAQYQLSCTGPSCVAAHSAISTVDDPPVYFRLTLQGAAQGLAVAGAAIASTLLF